MNLDEPGYVLPEPAKSLRFLEIPIDSPVELVQLEVERREAPMGEVSNSSNGMAVSSMELSLMSPDEIAELERDWVPERDEGLGVAARRQLSDTISEVLTRKSA